MRVARTETNIAYRRADNARWQEMDFVLGQRIKLSGDHPKKDICDKLAGDYPKDFLFDGWHPQCFCYVTPITLPPEETAHLTEMMLNGEDWRSELKRLKRGREITSYPENFKSWVRDNAENIEAARQRGTLPYFISNNQKAIDKILNPDSQETKSVLKKEEQQRIEQAQRKAEQDTQQKELTPIEQNNKELETALNIKQGKPMTFEEANEMRGNPHYAESEGYRVNCQTCVVANELRRRGFNVEALPNTKGSKNEALSGHTEMIWLDENGNVPQSTRVGATVERKRSIMTGKEMEVYTSLCNTKEELMALLESSINIDGRYHIKWMWERPQYGRFTGLKGHIITAERTNGEIKYYDPQNGRVIDDLANYANNLDLKRGIQFLRVDNLRANPEWANAVLTKPNNSIKVGTASQKGTQGVLRTITKEEVNLTLPNGGSIKTHDNRLANGNLNKREQVKFDKEFRMAKTFAENGCNVELIEEIPRIPSVDAIIDGLRIELKSLSSHNNIYNEAKDAIINKHADEVWFEFPTPTDKILQQIQKLKEKGIHGRFYFRSENKIYTY